MRHRIENVNDVVKLTWAVRHLLPTRMDDDGETVAEIVCEATAAPRTDDDGDVVLEEIVVQTDSTIVVDLTGDIVVVDCDCFVVVAAAIAECDADFE